ncbi:MAG TPA: DUF6174 domain-containing protein [Gemmatimonadaceae bacterium]|nr:DUF6174 domain-containing protein [Gemmatimonadaceae bacterium]
MAQIFRGVEWMSNVRAIVTPRKKDYYYMSMLACQRRILPVFIWMIFAGCINPFGSREERELDRAAALWRSKNITSYTFEMRTSCFCPPEINEWAIVDVRNGQIVGARSLTGTPLTGIALTSRKTVDQLFEAGRPPHEQWVDHIEFDYDPQLGYPTRLVLEGKRNIADAGVAYEARNLQERTLVQNSSTGGN